MKGIKTKIIGAIGLTVFAASATAQKVDQAATKSLNTVDDEIHSHDDHQNISGAGRMVFIDPKTGKILSGQDQIDAANAASSQKQKSTSVLGSGVASAPQLLENGTIKIELNGQFMMPLNVSIDKDGNMQKGHHIKAENESDKDGS